MENEAQPITPQTQTIAQDLAPIQPSSKKSSFLRTFFIVTGLILFGVLIGVLASRFLPMGNTDTQQAVEEQNIAPTEAMNVTPKVETTNPTVSPTIDPTANWETYTNSKYHYSFKYPENYAVDQNGMSSKTPETVEAVVSYDKTAVDSTQMPRFAVTVRNISQGDLQKQANDHYVKLSSTTVEDPVAASSDLGYQVINNQPTVNFIQKTFLGKTAYTYTFRGTYVNDMASEYSTPLPVHKYILVQNNDDIIVITLDDVELANNILSTFKFTN